MNWYWIVILSLAWIALLYAYSYWINAITLKRIEPLLEGMLFYGYMALYVSWPAIVLWQGLIDTKWYVWALLAAEVICLFLSALIVGDKTLRVRTSPITGSILDRAISWFMVAIILAIAPLWIALHVASGHDNRSA